MKILVCVKQVACFYSRTGMDSRGKIDADGIVYAMNPYDELALEEALRIKEGLADVEVTLISMGPQRVEAVLRYGLAMGADKAIHVCDERVENSDPGIRSKVLVEAIKNQAFDLILCGKKALDDNCGLVGGYLAELLDRAFVSSVTELEMLSDRKAVRMQQVLPRGDRQVMECDLPAVLSVDKGKINPRYPGLHGRINAEAKDINTVDADKLVVGALLDTAPDVKTIKLSISRPKPKKVFTPDSNLSPEERIKLLMSGGMQEKKSNAVQGGTTEDLADQFIRFVDENRIIRKGMKA